MFNIFNDGCAINSNYFIRGKLKRLFSCSAKLDKKVDVNDNISSEVCTNRNIAYHEHYKKLVSGVVNKTTLIQLENAKTEQLTDHGKLSHVDNEGKINMVNVEHKPDSHRMAIASGHVLLGSETFELVKQNKLKKGDVLTVAKIAGIMAAKQTSSLIPLCHNISLTWVNIELSTNESNHSVEITCTVRSTGQTGAEMEALTGVSVAALTVYDMCKAVSQVIVIGDIKLISKCGGKSGNFVRT